MLFTKSPRMRISHTSEMEKLKKQTHDPSMHKKRMVVENKVSLTAIPIIMYINLF